MENVIAHPEFVNASTALGIEGTEVLKALKAGRYFVNKNGNLTFEFIGAPGTYMWVFGEWVYNQDYVGSLD